MVYNGTYSGLNNSLWSPQFALPMVGSNLCAVDKGTFMEDQGIWDMLLNFMLSEEVIPFCGFDVMNVRKYEEWEKDISRGWEI